MIKAIVIGLIGMAAVGCTDDSSTSCPRDLPATCPDPVPSYANDVAPLITQYCETAACHSATGSGVGTLSPYNELYNIRVDAEDDIYSCKMPLMPPVPTDDERVTLLTWFTCGTPNN